MRYYFDVKSPDGTSTDPEGQTFGSDQESIEAAKREALGLAADYLRDGSAFSPKAIVIRTEQGRTVAEVDVSSVVKTFLG